MSTAALDRPAAGAGPRIFVTVAATFSAAHRLFVPERDEAWNRTTYGPCCRPSGHGHDYRLEVTVSGEVDETSGFVMEEQALRDVVQHQVAGLCHLRRLDVDVPFLAGLNPTAENLVLRFADRLREALGERLAVVRLFETAKNRAIWVAA